VTLLRRYCDATVETPVPSGQAIPAPRGAFTHPPFSLFSTADVRASIAVSQGVLVYIYLYIYIYIYAVR
jgi:hypothetical protein